jgi:tetratricopeptide (TPR) repeat protein
LLLEALEDQTLKVGLRTRYLFYLAQTYRDTSQFENAITFYTQHVAMNGWDEEVYWSLYSIGLCYEGLAKESLKKANVEDIEAVRNNEHVLKAIEFYKIAFEKRSHRCEALFALATLYGSLHMFDEQIQLCHQGKLIPYPKNDTLFILVGSYGINFDIQLVFSLYKCEKYKKIGKDILLNLLSVKHLPEVIMQNIVKASVNYL